MSTPQDLDAPVTADRTFTADDLAFLNRMVTTGQVLPSVAHELNNSLQIIAGMVEILGLKAQLAPDAMDKIQKIGVQAGKAAGLLRELVAFARRDGAMRKVDVRSAAERAVAFRRYYLSRGRVTMEVTAREDVPLVAQADSQAVVQVLVNLILNAEEAMAAGETRQASIELWRDGEWIYCEVRDSGPGFAPGATADAPFATRKSPAAGLGLAVARRLVERDGGSLTIEGAAPARVRVRWPATSA
jgi:two-component system NtrC family sensor kinase